jgi:hypothetical protein
VGVERGARWFFWTVLFAPMNPFSEENKHKALYQLNANDALVFTLVSLFLLSNHPPDSDFFPDISL